MLRRKFGLVDETSLQVKVTVEVTDPETGESIVHRQHVESSELAEPVQKGSTRGQFVSRRSFRRLLRETLKEPAKALATSLTETKPPEGWDWASDDAPPKKKRGKKKKKSKKSSSE